MMQPRKTNDQEMKIWVEIDPGVGALMHNSYVC